MREFEYDFGYAERFSHWLYQADQVGRAGTGPGLYAWFIRSPLSASTELACDPYRKVFAERSFKMAASAPLGERLEGGMKRVQLELPPPKMGEELNEELFAAAFAAFSPPVYIGRSKNVRSRLRQHVEALEEELGRLPDSDSDLTSIAPPDSPEESSKFGARMGALLRARGLSDYRGLFVKVVYAADPVATKRVEFLLNRTFHPILGRL
jgi:hypothetical protein